MALRIARINEAATEDHDLLGEYVAAKQAADQANRHLKIIEAKLAADMEERHQKTYKMIDGDKVRTVTYVRAERVQLDEKGLRRALTAKVYDKYTEKKLNRKALEEAMGRGEVDPMIVAKYAQPVPGTPFLRYTEKDAEE
jgi:hypothetical protein